MEASWTYFTTNGSDRSRLHTVLGDNVIKRYYSTAPASYNNADALLESARTADPSMQKAVSASAVIKNNPQTKVHNMPKSTWMPIRAQYGHTNMYRTS